MYLDFNHKLKMVYPNWLQMKIILSVLFILSINLSIAQTNPGSKFDKSNEISFLFSGHAWQSGTLGTKTDYRLEQLDKSSYTGIWLGGDVCSEAMLEYSTVQYIDSVFDLGNPDTHWALGNHDARNGNWEWYEEFSGRKTYYAQNSFNITRIIFNTNLVPTNCEMIDDQYDIITSVCDTIQQSEYLILLMHHNLWRDVPNLPNPFTYSQSDLRYWNANCDSVNTNFVTIIYPKLIEVKQRGIEVMCIIGDMGSGPKKFQMDSEDGIHFLGCGLDHNDPDDNVLIFNYDTVSKQLQYNFHNLDSLLTTEKSRQVLK